MVARGLFSWQSNGSTIGTVFKLYDSRAGLLQVLTLQGGKTSMASKPCVLISCSFPRG